jgi:hypothetical protein
MDSNFLKMIPKKVAEVPMRAIILISFLGLSACAILERDPRSGYASEEEFSAQSENLALERRVKDVNDVKEELGYGGRALGDGEREVVDRRMRLKRLEANIPSKREKKQYFNVRSALKNDSERIYFLSLPSFEARERWAQNRGLGNQEGYSDSLAATIEANDISLGMTQKAVSESWGDPDAIESAGNPLYGYERWKYNRYISGSDGYQKELRIVYFEGGHVVGWERD